ncbi:MAG: hypothetical protein OHK0019_28920 [Saprospiraceae bacterium]
MTQIFQHTEKRLLSLLFLLVTVTCVKSQSFSIGTLPNGKTIVVTYEVDVNASLPPGQCVISNQATVSGSNFATVSTDDPDVAGANNPTVTDVASPPSISTCPPSITVSTDLNQCTSNQSFAATVLACPTATVTYKIGMTTITSPHLFPKGTSTVDVSASNGVGTNASCSFTITVNDNQGPTITCPANQTVNASPTCTGTVGSWSAATLSDNCTATGSITVTQSPIASTALSGHNDFETVTLTADDGNGNTNNCMFSVTLKDVSPPSITCPANQTVSADGTCSGTVGSWSAASLSDNCTATGSITVVQSPIASTALSGHNDFETVTLTANDGNGNMNNCMFTVTLQDMSPPTVSCPANTTVAPTNTSPCEAVVNGIDASFGDNCSGSMLAYARSGASSGSNAGQASGLTYATGVTTVTYTATDGAGMMSSCMFTVTVSGCTIDFSGTIIWEHDDVSGIKDAMVNLTGSATGSGLTDVNGDFMIATSVSSGSFTLKPTKNLNKFNGVTAGDATAVQQHVANSVIITDNYKKVCADVNKSNSITTLDASLITQALLGNPSANTQFNTSWRFVPSSHTMTNPPWGFPEQRSYTGVSTSQTNQDFIGMKIGDVVAMFAIPANFGSSNAPLVLTVKDENLTAGAELTAEFDADQMDDLAAFQMTLRFDPVQLQFVEAQPTMALPLTVDNFGAYNISGGEIRVVWSQASGIAVDEDASVFRLKFIALQSGAKLKDALQLDESEMPALAYTSALAESKIELKFGTATNTDDLTSMIGLQLLQNRPNPFNGTTAIGFVLPESCEAQLRIFDVSGRMLAERKGQYPAGRNEETFDLETASGVFYYELTTPFGVLAKKMAAGF